MTLMATNNGALMGLIYMSLMGFIYMSLMGYIHMSLIGDAYMSLFERQGVRLPILLEIF